jgi:hypothetical protein
LWKWKRTTGNRGTELATGRCGGRGGASPFPVKGRRTRGAITRTSTRGRWWCGSHTWIGRRGDEGCCRRRGRAWAAPMRGGSGWAQFRRRGDQGWIGSGRVARGGGGEAVGRGNLGGVERSWRIPVSNVRRQLGVVRRKKRQSRRGKGRPVGFYSSALLQRREGEGEVTGRAQDSGRRRRA